MSWHVVPFDQKQTWSDYIQRAFVYDFYHTWHYFSLDRSGQPLLFVFEHGDDFIAFPLIRRSIGETEMFDLTSVYGYSGPVSNLPFDELSPTLIGSFLDALDACCAAMNVVTVFCTLHPVFRNHSLFAATGSVYSHGQTVAIDLSEPLEVQRAGYRKSYRQRIRQLKRLGYQTRIASTPGEVKEFAEIYRLSMQLHDAATKYFFYPGYFEALLHDPASCRLLLAVKDGKVAAGLVITLAPAVLQLHLSATHPEFLNDSPMKLLFDEASIVGRDEAIRFMHLGSGVGGARDNLFHFKSGFSNLYLDYVSWQHVVDAEKYAKLLLPMATLAEGSPSSYFPLYRHIVPPPSEVLLCNNGSFPAVASGSGPS